MKTDKIEIADQDLFGEMEWTRAKEASRALGANDGWRLPTREELNELYELYKKGVVNFTEARYWSSEPAGLDFAWVMDFKEGRQYTLPSDTTNGKSKVRAVRTLKLDIAKTNAPKKLDWYEAKEYVAALGDDWRLPTKDELNKMHEIHKNGYLNFGNESYWSIEEDGENSAFYKDFELGYLGGANRFYEKCVRAVRLV